MKRTIIFILLFLVGVLFVYTGVGLHEQIKKLDRIAAEQ